MIIPSKFNGFHGGVRRCFGGGGGGGGGGDGGGDAGGGSGAGGPNDVYAPKYTSNTGNTGFNPNQGSITGMNFTGGNTAGTSTIPSNNLNLRNMAGMPYNQVGQQYNALLQQGYTGNDIRNSLTTNGRPVSDSDYGFLVQNAGMTSPTGRPMAGSDQFFQPVYNTSYQNYARPSTQFNVSTYGTQPMNSPAFNSGMSRGNINNTIENFYQTNPMGRNADISNTLNFMRDSGVNREDFQSWAGLNNYGPQMSMPQMQSPFNPYSNSSGYGGFGGYNGGYGGGYGGFMPQMQTPFSYQQPSYGGYGGMGGYGGYDGYGMQSPFSYQQPATRYAGSGFSRGVRRAEGGIASLMDDAE